MLPCARERFRRCTVLRANRKSASQCASRRQKSGEWPNNGRKFVSTDQFSTWCRPRLRGKTWPTTPRKRAYTGLITLWVRKQVELVGAAGGTIVNIVRTVSTLTPKGENGHPPFVAKQILIALDSLFERVCERCLVSSILKRHFAVPLCLDFTFHFIISSVFMVMVP